VLYNCLTGDMPFVGRNGLDAIARSSINDYRPIGSVVPDAPPRLIELCEQAMGLRPADRCSLDSFTDNLREWLKNSGMERQAQVAFMEGREFLAKAQAYGRKHWDLAYPAFNAAVATFEKAMGLAPDFKPAAEARDQALKDFCHAAVHAGDIFLARMLFQGQRSPQTSSAESIRALPDPSPSDSGRLPSPPSGPEQHSQTASTNDGSNDSEQPRRRRSMGISSTIGRLLGSSPNQDPEDETGTNGGSRTKVPPSDSDSGMGFTR
jgi:hypothetical protein